jgi:hypothetical protein
MTTPQVWFECEKKIRYASEKRAEKILHRMRKHGNPYRGVRPYHCPHCQGWHLGHPRLLGRRRQRLGWTVWGNEVETANAEHEGQA